QQGQRSAHRNGGQPLEEARVHAPAADYAPLSLADSNLETSDISARPASLGLTMAMALPMAGAPVTPCAASSSTAAFTTASISAASAACGRNSCRTAISAFSCSAVSVRPACSY